MVFPFESGIGTLTFWLLGAGVCQARVARRRTRRAPAQERDGPSRTSSRRSGACGSNERTLRDGTSVDFLFTGRRGCSAIGSGGEGRLHVGFRGGLLAAAVGDEQH